jgi:hypothetical protein
VGWAARHISALRRGEAVEFRPKGGSMAGLIENGQLVRVEPLGDHVPKKGDIVLCKVQGNEYLHKITAVRPGACQISNNRNYVNGWASLASIYGVCVAVEGRPINGTAKEV